MGRREKTEEERRSDLIPLCLPLLAINQWTHIVGFDILHFTPKPPKHLSYFNWICLVSLQLLS